ncbi:unnamed protein product [Mycena citricolor]|uniref:Uncharacterized protein n=1 Tax=Mycena citricolor TaxID=2018698 RepID=A0AAD2GWD0_9AGAR|nr:unnamed protein product [Mycena citricolor]
MAKTSAAGAPGADMKKKRGRPKKADAKLAEPPAAPLPIVAQDLPVSLLEAALKAATDSGDMECVHWLFCLQLELTTSISWSTEDGIKATYNLIAHIEQDPDARNSLYPGKGSNPRSGGKSKTEYHWALAVAAFKTHPTLSEVFSLVENITGKDSAKARKPWLLKIKNRLECKGNLEARSQSPDKGESKASDKGTD